MSIQLPEPQQKALDEAIRLLRLNCDSFVICLRCSDESGAYSVDTFWEGVMPEAVGLAEVAILRMREIAVLKTDFTQFNDKE